MTIIMVMLNGKVRFTTQFLSSVSHGSNIVHRCRSFCGRNGSMSKGDAHEIGD